MTRDLLNDGGAFLRRDKDDRIRQCNYVVLLAWLRKQIVTLAQLDAADEHGPRKNDHFLVAMMGVARHAGLFLQADNRAAAARIVISEQAALDARRFGGFPFSPHCLVDQRCSLPSLSSVATHVGRGLEEFNQ